MNRETRISQLKSRSDEQRYSKQPFKRHHDETSAEDEK